MRRTRFVAALLSFVVAVVVGFGGVVGLPDRAVAQEDPPPLPELKITATDDAYQLSSDTVEAGWTIVTLDNKATEDVVADLVLLPEDRSVAEFQKSLNTDDGGSTIPDWFSEVVFAGGPSAPVGGTAQTLVELTPGAWTVLEVGAVGGNETPLAVTEATAEVEPPLMDAPVSASFGKRTIEIPTEIPAGYQIWKIANDDNEAHALVVIQTPAPVTVEQMVALLTTGAMPEGVDLSQAAIVGGFGLVSGERTIWTGFDLPAGYYVAMDYVPRKDGKINAELGQIAVFAVK